MNAPVSTMAEIMSPIIKSGYAEPVTATNMPAKITPVFEITSFVDNI
jgi:hypothetical protein